MRKRKRLCLITKMIIVLFACFVGCGNRTELESATQSDAYQAAEGNPSNRAKDEKAKSSSVSEVDAGNRVVGPLDAPCMQDITICQTDYDKANDAGECLQTWRNQKLDFAEMKVSLLECNLDGEDIALAFQIELPGRWDASDQKNIALNSLKFKIYLNGCETDAFRDRTIDPPMTADSYPAKEVIVSRVILSSSIQQVADQSDKAYLIPTWIVIYSTDHDSEMHFDDSILLINAIDGSYVSRW